MVVLLVLGIIVAVTAVERERQRREKKRMTDDPGIRVVELPEDRDKDRSEH